MIRITQEMLNEVSAKAKNSPRLRMNHNFHASLSDPVQRLLNALEPGTYIRPHRHANKEESFVLIQGKALAIIFDDNGLIHEHAILGADAGCMGVEFPENRFHTLTAIEPGTVVFEIKEGPFEPHLPITQAVWSPEEGSPEVRSYLLSLFDQLNIPAPGSLLSGNKGTASQSQA